VERGSGRRELLVSKGWVQAVALVVLFGFFVLGLLAYRTYSGQPPIPDRVVDPQGDVVFTGEDVRTGQEVFLRNGLMQYGSIFGHGAYLGPDFTADYLRRSALSVRESYGREGSDRAAVQTISDFKENRYDPETRTLEFTAPQAAAFDESSSSPSTSSASWRSLPSLFWPSRPWASRRTSARTWRLSTTRATCSRTS
jgi:nitric oxide reductase subunit B